MAKGSHLFPYRTQKLSLSAPMVLGWRRPGRVGRCRIPNKKNTQSGVLFICPRQLPTLPGGLSQVQHCTWLGWPWAASSGRREAQGQRPGEDSAKQHDTHGGVFYFPRQLPTLPGGLSQVQHCTWLGCPWAASSGRNEAHGQRPGAFITEQFVSLSIYNRAACFSISACAILMAEIYGRTANE